MIEYFSKKIVAKAKNHAIECYPEESCGVVVEGDYYPCENLSDNPLKDFKLDTKIFIVNNKKLEAIIHSHNNYPHTSKKDLEQQLSTNIPWGIINVVDKTVRDVFFWGDTLPRQDLIGRPFISGVYDCFNLTRDYYMKHKNIVLDMIPHDIDFYKKNENLFIDNFEKQGFVEVSKEDMKNDDVILGKVISKITNHCGIYIGNGLILHHLTNRVSRKEPIHNWKKYITHCLRYKEN